MTATPLDVNAFRIRQFNSIVLPFGLLVSTLHGYHGVPSYITDGSLGFIIGHEIIHSLDYSGQGFDLQGKLAMVWDQTSLVRWWTEKYCIFFPNIDNIFIADTIKSPSVWKSLTIAITKDKFYIEDKLFNSRWMASSHLMRICVMLKLWKWFPRRSLIIWRGKTSCRAWALQRTKHFS